MIFLIYNFIFYRGGYLAKQTAVKFQKITKYEPILKFQSIILFKKNWCNFSIFPEAGKNAT